MKTEISTSQLNYAANINISCLLQDTIKCNIHGSTLQVQPKTFKVYCYLCDSGNDKNALDNNNQLNQEQIVLKQENLKLNKLEIDCKKKLPSRHLNEFLSEINNSDIRTSLVNTNKSYCIKHPEQESILFCSDCNEEFCKLCYPKHKKHNFAPPEIVAMNFEKSISNLSDSLSMLKQTTQINLENVKPVQEFYKGIKEFIDKNLNSNSNKINNIINDKSNFFYTENQKLFKGIDKEVDETAQILEQYKEKILKANQKIMEFGNEITQISSSNNEVCLFKKRNSKELLEIDLLITEAENFINDKFKRVKSKAEDNLIGFEDKSKAFISALKKFEENIILSLHSGISSICYRVRRFKQFYSYEIAKYFRNSAICVMVNKTITLSGLGLCGLFVNNLYKKVPSMPLLLEVIESYFVNISNQNTKNEVNPYDVKEGKRNNKNSNLEEIRNTLVSKEIELPSIKNIIDPVYQLYFDKSILMHKDRIYYITLRNLSKDDFVKIWSGSIEDEIVSDKKKEETEFNNNQTVICNDTYVKFNMIPAFDFESDFNEFTMGLISDFIYSYSG